MKDDELKIGIQQISVAVCMDHDTLIRKVVAVDDNGRGWELTGHKWTRLPDIPEDAR